MVSGFVHRIFRACSSWQLVHEGLERAKALLENNQYPPRFYEKIIHDTLTKIVEASPKPKEEQEEQFLIFLQYRGKCSETYARDLRKTEVPCRVIFTMRKLKTVTPSLKPPIERNLKSGVIYKIQCPRCTACYVGATTRHVITRFKEQIGTKEKSVYKHLMACDARSDVSEKDLDIVCSTLRGEVHPLTLEALWIRDMKPSINVKDEYKSRVLVIKF